MKRGNFFPTWMSEKFSEVVNVLPEQGRDRQYVGPGALLLHAQGSQLRAAQILQGSSTKKQSFLSATRKVLTRKVTSRKVVNLKMQLRVVLTACRRRRA